MDEDQYYHLDENLSSDDLDDYIDDEATPEQRRAKWLAFCARVKAESKQFCEEKRQNSALFRHETIILNKAYTLQKRKERNGELAIKMAFGMDPFIKSPHTLKMLDHLEEYLERIDREENAVEEVVKDDDYYNRDSKSEKGSPIWDPFPSHDEEMSEYLYQYGSFIEGENEYVSTSDKEYEFAGIDDEGPQPD